MGILKIASFNAYKYSAYTNKDIEMIARLIQDCQIDIVAIQEIFSEAALKRLLDVLGREWTGKWASPESKSASAAEGYAFVWNKQRIELSSNRNGKVFYPVIHNQYPHKEFGSLIRNPFYGRFVMKANRMIEIRLINTHIMFSQGKPGIETDDNSLESVGDIELRNRELNTLASKILPKLDDKVYDRFWDENDMICRKPYTFLLGDYNLNLKGSSAKGAYIKQPVFYLIDGSSIKRIETFQDELTTLKSVSKESGRIEGYSNNYDHFTYDTTRPVKTRCFAIKAPDHPLYYNGDYVKYKNDISDHLMIVMQIDFT